MCDAVQSPIAILQFDNPPPQNPNTMRSMIVIALFVAVAAAVPVDPKSAVVVSYVNENIGVDGYKFGYETSDGKSAQESAVLKNVGSENEALEVQGQYSYVGDNGVTYLVKYIANEKGFQPEGAHLPVA
ncbi:hypothetical protein O3G_MSEX010267 [Manduca sexta]|uniref:Uncharacterized protein n=2 Tax=Manduca sexta TaxID=7130 RepID=A0A921ZGQ9_MANSE|nr:hypothetical protein O3G_MSEX010267 [Manduca sexta]